MYEIILARKLTLSLGATEDVADPSGLQKASSGLSNPTAILRDAISISVFFHESIRYIASMALMEVGKTTSFISTKKYQLK